jgi:hypothetical protein
MLCEEKTEQTGSGYVQSWPSGHAEQTQYIEDWPCEGETSCKKLESVL